MLERRIRRELDGSHLNTVVKRSNVASCMHYEIVKDIDTLIYPNGFEYLQNPITTVAKSSTATRGINRLLQLKVPGLDGATVQDILNELQRGNCLSFPYGPSVRDQFLSETSKDLVMVTNCAPETIFKIIKSTWGTANCKRLENSTVLQIGNSAAKDGEQDVIDAVKWDNTFFGSGAALDYTTNSLAYVSGGLDIVIDITGHGVNDTCNKKIRIPVGENERDTWVNTDKVFRYWMLRIRGYDAVDDSTKAYIESEAITRIENGDKGFMTYYCKNVLGGNWMFSTGTCIIPHNKCRNALNMKSKFDLAFKTDLGDFWKSKAKSLIAKLECNSCSSEALCGVEKREITPTAYQNSTTPGNSATMLSESYLMILFSISMLLAALM